MISTRWYHTIELPGTGPTSGLRDHRPHLAHYHFPESLQGKTVIDVGCAEGFFSFFLESLGAREVLSVNAPSLIDYDASHDQRRKAVHAGQLATSLNWLDRFHQAKHALGSRARLLAANIYELDEDRVGQFDLVFCSDVLLHLRNPFSALERLFRITRPGGTCMITSAISPFDDSTAPLPMAELWGASEMTVSTYWFPTRRAMTHMLKDAGFNRIESFEEFRIVPHQPRPDVCFHAIR